MILHCDLLRPQMLLDRYGKVRAALNSRVVGNDNGLMTMNHPNARHQALIVPHCCTPFGEGTEFKERCVGIDHGIDAFANEHLCRALVASDGGLTAAVLHTRELIEVRPRVAAWPSVVWRCHESLLAHVVANIRNDFFRQMPG